MIVLIWATLLLSVGSSADTGASSVRRNFCQDSFCVNLNTGEIIAETGLCVVIPCSFTTDPRFDPQSVVWFKCEPSKQRCGDSDLIYKRNGRNIQAAFKGRVSLLEPDVTQKNCSIIINDVTASDSGSYQLRVNGVSFGIQNGFQYATRAKVSVKALTQRPTVEVPPLTEGQQSTLSCTAPGLCSGSAPVITWMLSGAGENDSHITGNITEFTENLTAYAHRHSSTWSFTPSAKHHGANVTCKVSFIDGTTTEETTTLSVTYMEGVEITGNTSVREGEPLQLTCTVKSFPPSLVTWTKFSDESLKNGSETDLLNDTLNHRENNSEPYLQRGLVEATFSILNVTADDSGEYICTAKHLNNTLMKKVDVKVIYMEGVGITGNTSVREGEPLQLTCTVKSFPPSFVTWTKFSDESLKNGSETDLLNDTLNHRENNSEPYLQRGLVEATFSILNVTADDSGEYICTAKHLNNTLMKKVDVKVIYTKTPVITGNTSPAKGGTLNLTCSVQSFPPSNITWTLLGSSIDLQNKTASATLIIPDVQVENSGRYICTASHLDKTATVFANVTVIWFPSIFKVSRCEIQFEVLTCVCISEGFPLPTIKWPILRSHTVYSVGTSVANHTVNSTLTLTVRDNSTSAVCVSGNAYGEATEILTIQKNMSEKEDELTDLKTFLRLEVIIAFLIGVLLSAVFCFLVKNCHRKRQKSSGNLDLTMEMVNSQDDPLISAGQEVKDDQTYEQKVTDSQGSVEEEEAFINLDGGSNEVVYANVDFSVLKRRTAKRQESTKTEYAEIKKDAQKQRGDNDAEEDEVLQGNQKEEMTEEEEEVRNCVPEKTELEEVEVYSNVKDLIDVI